MFSIVSRVILRTPKPPGQDLALRQVEADGQEVTVIVRGDAIDVYHGRKEINAFSMSPRIAVRFAWFVLWRWWVNVTWCGLKTRAWFWAIRREKPHGQAEANR